MTGRFSYVLPLRLSAGDDTAELTTYLQQVVEWCDDLIVVDGSSEAVFAENHERWDKFVRHVIPDPAHACLMGKVPGVLTGIDLAAHDRIVLADDDVRYDHEELQRVVDLLDDHDLVRPQNYFRPLPWHALWDTARTLLNRALGGDFPGTLGVRRATVRRLGGYDGDVLFENLELIRTVEAGGGVTLTALDLYVRRLPPTAGHFWGQRTRQAYDDFAIPARMTIWLSIVPGLLASLVRRRRAPALALVAIVVATAETGRRRAGGTRVFPALASVLAPLWVLERGVCAWLAVLQRVRYGGVRYGDSIIRTAGHSPQYLRQRTASGKVRSAGSTG